MLNERKRCNVYVDVEQYTIFQQYSKLLNFSFTELVNSSLISFNTMFADALKTGDVDGLMNLLKLQVETANQQLIKIREQTLKESVKKKGAKKKE